MKKMLFVLLSFALLFGFCGVQAGASETAEATQESGELVDVTENAGRPKLILDSYRLATDSVTPGSDSKLTVVIKNPHKTADALNCKLTFAATDGAVLPAATDSVYVEKLGRGESYIWVLPVTAAASAESGKHSVMISAEYETADGEACSAVGNLTLGVYNPPKQEPSESISQPRLMVCEYQIDAVKPGENTALKITVKNTDKNQAVKNIKLSLSEDSGELRFDGLGNAYVERIAAGGSYTWETQVSAVNTAAVGEHAIQLQTEYEGANGGSYTATDTLRISVVQTVALDYDGATLPVKVVQGDTVTATVNLMNTGKSQLYNCRVAFAVEQMQTGGSSFAGEIAPGESKSCNINLRVASDFEGDVKGRFVITYEDAFGNSYEKSGDVSTLIEKKIEKVQSEEEEKKNGLWWLFLLLGILAGGGIGVGTVFAVFNARQRKEDEKRL